MDEALIKQQAEIYKMNGVDEDTPAIDPVKKRKAAQQQDVRSCASCHTCARRVTDVCQPNINKRSKGNATVDAASKPKPANTAIFVTGLPDDVGKEELRDVFKKYGIINESIDDDEKRIKLYNDKDGKFKGEALIGEQCRRFRHMHCITLMGSSLSQTSVSLTGRPNARRV